MRIIGNILKLRTVLNDPVTYYLDFAGKEFCLNDLIGKQLELQFLHQINCIRCGKKTSKSFAQGYCFPCFRSAPETEECVLRPELCRAHNGFARDLKYAANHCLIDHFVYLSFTNKVKVGVTRYTQIPTRWIDQGALAAIKIAKTPNRYTAGLIEVALKDNFHDKTNWKNMLSQEFVEADLHKEKQKAIGLLPGGLIKFASDENTVTNIEYPMSKRIVDFKSFDLDKVELLSDILIGIKGQYLLFEKGSVINIRKYGGYLVSLNI
jgi:hypothetical protein